MRNTFIINIILFSVWGMAFSQTENDFYIKDCQVTIREGSEIYIAGKLIVDTDTD